MAYRGAVNRETGARADQQRVRAIRCVSVSRLAAGNSFFKGSLGNLRTPPWHVCLGFHIERLRLPDGRETSMTGDERALRIGAGGREFVVQKVELYPEEQVREWQATLRYAQEQLGGFSTGVGFFASPGVALAGAAALGVLEGAISDAKAKKGVRALVEASEMLAKLRASGEFVDVNDVHGIEHPSPNEWCLKTAGEVTVDLTAMSFSARNKFVEKHKVSFWQNSSGAFNMPGEVASLVMIPSDFIKVEADGRALSIRWAAVDFCELASDGKA